MNSTLRKTNKLTAAIGLLVICSSVLVACGGSGESSDQTAGIGGTGIVFGKITGFGSVHVNGSKFETDTSQFDVDGDTGADQSDLALGMVIKLNVEVENGVLTSKALEVVYDDEIEGPVTVDPPDPMNLTIKTGTILGQTVTFDEVNTIFVGTSFDSLGDEPVLGVSDVIEVSGFRVSPTEITATYVRFIEDLGPDSEIELRGTVDQYVPGGTTFVIEGTGTVVNFDPTGVNTEIDVPGGVVSNGLYVEVEGVFQAALLVDADKIEAEDEDFGDEVDDISLQGIVLVYNGINDFFIGTQRVDASTAKFSPTSLMGMNLLGMNIEVEGEIVGGTLIADEVEARDGDTKLRAPVSSVNLGNNSFQVTFPVATGPTTMVVVNINGQTLFEDETSTPPVTAPFSLDDLMATDFVRVEGQEVGGEVEASVVKRTDGVGQDLKLEGVVDTFVTNSSITILGIIYEVDPTPGTGTDFEGFGSSTDFFDALNPLGGDFVEIEDDDVADGVADEVELE